MKEYIFNRNGDPKLPSWCEENIYSNIFVKINLVNLFNTYAIDDNVDDNVDKQLPIININEKVILFLIASTNSAHSISEIIDFINFQKKYENLKICISENILITLPFLYQLIKIFIPEEKFIILKNLHLYKIDTLITYRNAHFNYLNNWASIPFQKNDNIIYFDDLNNIKENFCVNSIPFLNKIEEIYNNYKNNYTLYDNIMLVKTNQDKYVFSKDRCMDKISDNVINLINNKNIKILSINDFKDIYEYICVFYHAKNIIVSYGGVACTNRFFCNPNSNVILIANLHYKPEYEYENSNQMYWHLRHSHIYPAKTQEVLLDFENFVDETNVNKIFNLLKY
jgi:hypothetical protein